MNRLWRLLPYGAMGLLAAQLALMFASWLLGAANPVSGIRSLLSGEGLRWLLGRFADTMASPLLVWLVVLAMAYGALCRSRLLHRPATYRERRALMIALLLLALIVIVMLLLTVIPHAVLLSATGALWPSPFTASLLPVTAWAAIVISTAYGLVAGTFNDMADVFDALTDGIGRAAPLFLLYILAMQLWQSVCFVFAL